MAKKRIGASLTSLLNKLKERIKEFPRDQGIVVHRGSSYRSSITASLLQQQGIIHIVTLPEASAHGNNAVLIE